MVYDREANAIDVDTLKGAFIMKLHFDHPDICQKKPPLYICGSILTKAAYWNTKSTMKAASFSGIEFHYDFINDIVLSVRSDILTKL